MSSGRFTFTMDKARYNALVEKMKRLQDFDKKDTISKGLREAVKPVIAQGKSNLASSHKVKTGKLRASQGGTRTYRGKAKIKAGFKQPGGAVAHLLDRGTKKRYTKKGYYRGSISAGAPKHGSFFWTNAVESRAAEALNILADFINEEIIKLLG